MHQPRGLRADLVLNRAVLHPNDQLTSRTNAEHFRCPRCDAKPGDHCTGARGKRREASHRERHERATRLFELCGGSWALAREMEH